MPFRLKPEYKKMLQIYPSFEEEVNRQYLAEGEGFITNTKQRTSL